MAKLPGFMFYPGDWLKDPALRSCSLGSRGLWIDMLCLMHESSRRGFLQHPNGSPVTAEQIARMVGCSPGEATGWLNELDNAGVFSRTADGVIFSRRIDRDERKRTLCAEAGRRGGGNPTFIGVPKGQSKGDPKVPPKVPPNDSMKMVYAPPPPSSTSDSESDARARKVAARIAATDPPPSGPFYDTANGLLAGLFGRQGGLLSHEARHLSEFAGWVESQPPATIHGEAVAPDALALRCVEAAVQDRIDGTVKGACSWCRQVYDRCTRQGCWPHETPERKSKFEKVKPKRDFSKITEGL